MVIITAQAAAAVQYASKGYVIFVSLRARKTRRPAARRPHQRHKTQQLAHKPSATQVCLFQQVTHSLSRMLKLVQILRIVN